MSAEDRDRLATLITEATRRGADAADAVLIRSTSISHAQRLGEMLHILNARLGSELSLLPVADRGGGLVFLAASAGQMSGQLAGRHFPILTNFSKLFYA